MFVGVNLYWFSTFEHFKPHGSPLNQMADLGLLANMIRIPYFLSLTGALWGTVRRTGRANSRWPDASEMSPIGDSDALASRSTLGSVIVSAILSPNGRSWPAECGDRWITAVPITRVALSGLGFASDEGCPLCAGRGPCWRRWNIPLLEKSGEPFQIKRAIAVSTLCLDLCGGLGLGARDGNFVRANVTRNCFCRNDRHICFHSGLRRVSSVHGPIPRSAAASELCDADLFSVALYPTPVKMYGYVVALSLYAGAIALCVRWRFTAAVLLMFATCVFTWKKNLPIDREFDRGREQKRAALRFACMVIPALLVTTWALLDGVAHRNALAEANAANAMSAENSSGTVPPKSSSLRATALGADGYQSVILWPYPARRPVLPPIAAENELLPPGTKVPLMIRFNGPYWYLQPPQKSPGPSAHVATGTPIGFEIRSSNSAPLVMDAHQYLSASVPIARCREIAVEIENHDNTSGEISLGVLLSAGASTKDPTLYLGEQPILSTQPGNFAFKRAPVFETLHFSIPAEAKIRKFREITVVVFPDIEHTFDAPKIAIQQFQLYPR